MTKEQRKMNRDKLTNRLIITSLRGFVNDRIITTIKYASANDCLSGSVKYSWAELSKKERDSLRKSIAFAGLKIKPKVGVADIFDLMKAENSSFVGISYID